MKQAWNVSNIVIWDIIHAEKDHTVMWLKNHWKYARLVNHTTFTQFFLKTHPLFIHKVSRGSIGLQNQIWYKSLKIDAYKWKGTSIIKRYFRKVPMESSGHQHWMSILKNTKRNTLLNYNLFQPMNESHVYLPQTAALFYSFMKQLSLQKYKPHLFIDLIKLYLITATKWAFKSTWQNYNHFEK